MIFWKSTKSLKRVDFFSLRFSQTCEFWSSKANRRLRFSPPSIILTDLLGNKTLLRSWFLICDWRISIHFVCSCVSRFVTCDRNYDWRQPKTQLWGRLLNYRVCMFLKSTVRQEKTLKDSKRRFSFYCMLLSFVLYRSTSVYSRRRSRFVNSAFQQEKFGPKIEVSLWQTNLKANVCRNSTFKVNRKKNATTGRRRLTSSNRAGFFVSTSCEERHNKQLLAINLASQKKTTKLYFSSRTRKQFKVDNVST